ncbi:MAG: alpha/beta hydrolase [Actinomycetes bacterium]
MADELPVGYYRFTRNRFLNYQLNRWYSLGYTRLEDIAAAGRQIRRASDSIAVFTGLAETAVQDGRLRNAAFNYRAAEFHTDPRDPDKVPRYRSFRTAFDDGFAGEGFERHQVPYRGAALSAARLPPVGPRRGTVVIHGGVDSFIEEFFCFWRYFADLGYEVVAFDGPGQGATHRLHGLAHEHDWERPVGAILDHFDLSDVTLLGISFGGYWCLRAAAFDKRIARVIVDPPLYDLVAVQPVVVRAALSLMMRSERFMNWSIRVRARAIPTLGHVVNQILYITNSLDAAPVTVARWMMAMNAGHLHSELVTQDVLLLAGEKDRFQPPKLYHAQRAALTSARSVTGRVFTAAEQAENHVQIGNVGLGLDAMGAWLRSVEHGTA